MRYSPDLSRISDAVAAAFGVREVYGEPVERDGAIVLPAARVWSSGGAGGGGGTEPAGSAGVTGPADLAEDETGTRVLADGGGGGVGFTRRARPVGAFVLDEHGVRWVPAIDVNRMVLGGQVAFVLAAAVVGWAVVCRSKR